MLRVGMIGWRGMVGSVLMQRMREENDFNGLEARFFSTSSVGGAAPKEAANGGGLQDATDLRELAQCDVLISCQGGEYTTEVYGPLRKSGWKGYWIDAASTLRMSDDAAIILDPVNDGVIRDALARGLRDICRRQLHCEPDAHGRERAVQGGAGRVDDHDDLSGRIRRRGGENAGIGEADGMPHRPDARESLRECARSGSHGDRSAARREVARERIRRSRWRAA